MSITTAPASTLLVGGVLLTLSSLDIEPHSSMQVWESLVAKCTEKNLSSVFAERRLFGMQFSPKLASANGAAQLEAASAPQGPPNVPNHLQIINYTLMDTCAEYHLPPIGLSQSQSSSFGASMGVPPLAMSSSTEYADDLGLGIATLASFGRIERIDARISCSSPELSASDLSPA